MKRLRISDIEALTNKRYDEMEASKVLKIAEQLGTLNADDRSKQYPIENFEKLKEATNLALTKARRCERLSDEKHALILAQQKEIKWLKRLYVPLVSILTGLAWEGVRACAQHYLSR